MMVRGRLWKRPKANAIALDDGEAASPVIAARQRRYGDRVVGAALGMSEGAVKVAVHRLRRRYRELLEGEIARTVATPDEVEAEIRYLITAIDA